jgi:hypothetical protein
MTAALTPALALDYLHQMSADIRAAIVLDAAGNRLAGPPALAAAARELLAVAPLVSARCSRGLAFGARDELHGIVAATGPLALPGLALHDLGAMLQALGGRAPRAPAEYAPAAAAEAVLSAFRTELS